MPKEKNSVDAELVCVTHHHRLGKSIPANDPINGFFQTFVHICFYRKISELITFYYYSYLIFP